MWLRTAIRVLATLWQGDLDLDSARHPGDVIYESASEAADWAGLLPASGMTVAVSGVISGDCGKLTSSQLLQARIRDAVCDAVRESKGWRPPPVGREQPTLPLHAHVRSGRMTLYRDVGGGSLHRRGYRSAMHKAALNEAAAAGCLVLAGWPEVVANKPDAMLLDPFCGSGTILVRTTLTWP